MIKKGDTLIEVTLAMGIFSMIAIAIVAVMSSGTAGAQTALETTLAREEIDTQAEALRFIQSSHATEKGFANQRFTKLWQEIINNAIDLSGSSEEQQANIVQYTPKSCQDNQIFGSSADFSPIRDHAFVINPRNLGTFTEKTTESVYVSKKQNPNVITEASIYPRLLFGTNQSQTPDSLIENNTPSNLYRAEGIYVIAVKDSDTTHIVDKTNLSNKTSAFYDFYIRTCWYGSDANEPSTISTVIRLYDSDTVNSDS